jgi:hypothetical protein
MFFWKKIDVIGEPPLQRQRHSGIIGNNDLMYIFGGRTENSLNNDLYSVKLKLKFSSI